MTLLSRELSRALSGGVSAVSSVRQGGDAQVGRVEPEDTRKVSVKQKQIDELVGKLSNSDNEYSTHYDAEPDYQAAIEAEQERQVAIDAEKDELTEEEHANIDALFEEAEDGANTAELTAILAQRRGEAARAYYHRVVEQLEGVIHEVKQRNTGRPEQAVAGVTEEGNQHGS